MSWTNQARCKSVGYIKTYKSPTQYQPSANWTNFDFLRQKNVNLNCTLIGNGHIEGQDISHAIQFLQLPTEEELQFNFMDKNKFKKWSSQFSNVRNMVAGTANAWESFPNIDFVAYEIITQN